MIGKKGIVKRIILGFTGVTLLFVLTVIINLIIFEKNGSVVSKGQPIANYGENNRALLIVDIQEATTGESSLYPFFKAHSAGLINNINQLSESFTRQNNRVIYVRSEITNPLINLINNSYAKGSRGAMYDKRLKIVSGLEVVKSGEDSFRHTNLDSILTGNKINELYIVGLDAAECINATVEAAQHRNYSVNLVQEALLSKSQAQKDSMIRCFKERGVKVVSIEAFE